jgi:hypothetical protein
MKKLGWVCCLSALLLAGAWGLAGCSDQPGILKGTVISASDGTPLVGAEVHVFSLDRVEGTSSDMPVFTKGPMLEEQPADEDGQFSFALDPGDYVVGVWLEGEEVASGRAEVRSGRTTTAVLSADARAP